MKSLSKNLLLLAGMVSLSFLFSCGGDDVEEPTAAPSLSVTASKTYTTEDTVSFDVTYDVPGGFGGFNYSFSADDGTDVVSFTKQLLSPDKLDGVNSTETSGSFTFKPFGDSKIAALGLKADGAAYSLAGKSVTFKFEILHSTDTQADSTDVTFAVEEASPKAKVYSATLLYAPLEAKTGKNFFASSTGTTYSADDVLSTTTSVSPTIDFGYYYGNTDKASIASPKGFESTTFSAQVSGWGTKNATKIRTTTLTSGGFTEVQTEADIDEVYEAGTDKASGIVSSLAKGSVVAFETVGGKRGLILVQEIKAGFNSTDYIKIDVLVQN